MPETSKRFNPLDYPALGLQPDRLTAASVWVGHIPFAFMLIEMARPNTLVELGSQAGESYCAFCQAIVHLGLATRCTAIDTWDGDINIGRYDGKVYESLKAHHDPRFGGFSTLKRSTFEQAVKDFADKSIDLLHIDGTHTYDAVKQDFEVWRPKVSDRGVIIMHDTMVRAENFGVYRLWDEIAPKYPSLNFRHSHGLGVLAIGKDVSPALLEFIALAQEPAERERILGYFERQGQLIDVMRQSRGLSVVAYEWHRLLEERNRVFNQPVRDLSFAQFSSLPFSELFALLSRTRDAFAAEVHFRKLAQQKSVSQ